MQFAEISLWAVYQSICKIWTAQATNQNSPFHPWPIQPYNTGDKCILHVNLHPKFHFQVPGHDQLHFQWLCCLYEGKKILKKIVNNFKPKLKRSKQTIISDRVKLYTCQSTHKWCHPLSNFQMELSRYNWKNKILLDADHLVDNSSFICFSINKLLRGNVFASLACHPKLNHKATRFIFCYSQELKTVS